MKVGPSRRIDTAGQCQDRRTDRAQGAENRYFPDEAVKISGCMAFDLASAAAILTSAVNGIFTGGRQAELLQAW